jgi:hypothetical protein
VGLRGVPPIGETLRPRRKPFAGRQPCYAEESTAIPHLERLREKFPVLGAFQEDWEPVSRGGLTAWMVFYLALIGNAILGGRLLQWFDLVFVPIHEAGHLLFRFFGQWLTVIGGTFLQLFVPFALALYFLLRRQLPGTAFCAFFFFEQFLPIGTYMADARSQSLQYVTVGDPELAVHDWFYLFSHAGILRHDTQIGGTFRLLGWVGMLAVTFWFSWRAYWGSAGK